MIRHLAILIFFVSVMEVGKSQTGNIVPYGNNPAAGGYVAINGIKLYYESYGEGRPLVILHGSGGQIRNHRARIDYFRQFFRVIAIDSRSQGKSIDEKSEHLTYDQMASDVNVLLDSLHVDSAYIWGQSDGGIIAIMMAYKYPKKVARFSTFGANLFPGDKAIYQEVDQMVKDTLKVTKNFQTRRLFEMLDLEPHITLADLHKITAPALIMAGDKDVIRPEHTQLIFENIPSANLFIMPGATHGGASEKQELFNLVLKNFFTQPFVNKSSIEMFTGKKPK